jgi:hypothetical protein
MANLNSCAIQEHALNFTHFYNLTFSSFADVSISIKWTPADTHLPSFCQATFHAQEECAQPLHKEIETRNILSVTYQKQKTWAEAFKQWAQQWHTKPCTLLVMVV